MSSKSINQLLESVEKRGGRIVDTALTLRAFPCLVSRIRGMSESIEMIRDILDFGKDMGLKTDLATRNKLLSDIKEELRQIEGLQVSFLGDYTKLRVTYPTQVTEDVEDVYRKKLRYRINETLA